MSRFHSGASKRPLARYCALAINPMAIISMRTISLFRLETRIIRGNRRYIAHSTLIDQAGRLNGKRLTTGHELVIVTCDRIEAEELKSGWWLKPLKEATPKMAKV